MAYSVPKLTDFSDAALSIATEALKSALREERLALWQEAVAIRKHSGLGHTADWQPFRNRWVGRKLGVITQLNENWLKQAPNDRKREVGKLVNELKSFVEEQVQFADSLVNIIVKNTPDSGLSNLDDADRYFQIDHLERRLTELRGERQTERLDITLPGIRRPIGVELDRKILADLAVKDPAGFGSLAEQAKKANAAAA